jgi:hypothetical protein
VNEGVLLVGQFKADRTVTWSLDGRDASLLNINAQSGGLAFVAPLSLPDGQGDGHYDVTVVATDARGNASQQIVTLTVKNTPDRTPDPADQDGIAAAVENAATNGRSTPGDLNNDGIPDSEQANVTAVPWVSKANFDAATSNPANALPDSYACLEGGQGVRVSNVAVVNPTDLAVSGNGSSAVPATITSNGVVAISYPYDPLAFRLESIDTSTNLRLNSFVDAAPALADGSDPYPGIQVRQVINLPGNGLRINTYLKWNPAANNGAGGWFTFLADGNPNTYDNGAELIDFNHDGLIDQIVLTYTDGSVAGG